MLFQGLIWITFAILTEVPAVVMMGLNFNSVMDIIFLASNALALTMGAMRLYRSLFDFTQNYNPSGYKSSDDTQNRLAMVPVRVGIRRSTELSGYR